MYRNEYIAEVNSRLRKLFDASKAGYKLLDIERHRLEGFIQAGIFLELATKTEMTELLESVHLSVFGKSIGDRKQEKQASWPSISVDYDQYEQPTFERKE